VSGVLELEDARTPLLDFYWDSFGPISWSAGLDLVGAERRRYLAVGRVSGYRVVASVEPWDDPLAVSAVVTAYLASNGSKHRDGLFGGLPHEVTNYRPALLPHAVVKQALFDYMQWAERAEAEAWSTLAEEHYGRVVEPDHLRRVNDLLETHPAFGDPDSWDAWLEEQQAESTAMPDHARQRLFDEWFATAYRTSP
jgi:hypothetical protein